MPELTALGDVLEDVKPGFACGDESTDGVFQIRMNNITRSGNLDFGKRRRVPAGHKSIRATLLRPNDILFNATNSPDLVGKTALFKGLDENVVFSNHFLRLRADTSKVDPGYLARWLHYEFEHGVFKAMCRQWVNQATVAKEALLGLSVPLPAVPEQQAAVGRLDQVDTVRTQRQETLTLLDSLTRSIFREMFGDVASNDHGWESAKVSDFVQGFQSGKNFAPAEEETGLRVLKVSAVTSGVFDPAESKPVPADYVPPQSHFVREGDLLFSRANTSDLVGATALVTSAPPNLLLPDKLWRFVWHEPAKAVPIFVYHLFQQPEFRRKISQAATGTSSSMKNVSQPKVLAIACGLPPLDLQQEFARKIEHVTALQESASESLTELNTLFVSLQHQAFSGEL